MATGVGNAVTDRLWGTRAVTVGAEHQLPRRIPVRIEPKTFFALERTYLSWMHMAVTLGGVTSALVGFSYSENAKASAAGAISQHTVQIISLLLLPIAVLMMVYALYIYYMRSVFLEKKQYGFFDDKLGPVVLCVLIMLALSTIMVVAIIDYNSVQG
mmetsp:Transcript_6679/g.19222  ORF Transcript_6679/g.19222 Transcript_6679/m.19222 type:complete len:157 (+) Transcript_6679:440-910(+)|eukprot:CAMPEP_0206135670 /NCGR_PEP_ID=MMETSP1473-20131121/939_1 /ASSEMBLY_ACC=CAM_ASM_001109 /TAXON_ID=1461547 /ORGANISM="Stichococcus sp, Strain RCC1054" /LENGTH=156 /DNA_ID=CAMNT_0053527679 /DNA_START=390 /DNA_END=860 /DNA_ORIENTATION=-